MLTCGWCIGQSQVSPEAVYMTSAGHYFCGFQGSPEREGYDGGGVASGISSGALVILFLLGVLQ